MKGNLNSFNQNFSLLIFTIEAELQDEAFLEGVTKFSVKDGIFSNLVLFITGKPDSIVKIHMEIISYAFTLKPPDDVEFVKEIQIHLRKCETGESYTESQR